MSLKVRPWSRIQSSRRFALGTPGPRLRGRVGRLILRPMAALLDWGLADALAGHVDHLDINGVQRLAFAFCGGVFVGVDVSGHASEQREGSGCSVHGLQVRRKLHTCTRSPQASALLDAVDRALSLVIALVEDLDGARAGRGEAPCHSPDAGEILPAVFGGWRCFKPP